jgi:transcriptional regulator with XRE-family HTH domain
MLLRHALGAALRRLRLAQGRTLRDLAAASRVSVPYLSEIERGRKEPSSEIIATICRALGISLDELIIEIQRELVRAVPAASRGVVGITATLGLAA